MRLWLYPLLAQLMLTACGPSEESASEKQLLIGEELRATIAGHSLTRPLAPGQTEYYCDDGRWLLSGARTPIYGTYTINGEALCLNRGGRSCFRIYRTGAKLWRQPMRPEMPTLDEVELTPLPSRCF